MKTSSCLLLIGLATAAAHLSSWGADVAATADTPLLFCIGVHVEPLGARVSHLVGNTVRTPTGPGPDYNREPLFRRHVADLRALAAIVEKHGGKMTVQVQSPFTTVCWESGERILADFEKHGHEIALHLHEDAHLGRGSERLPVETWAAVMKEEIELIKKAGATRVRYWSGGNLYPDVLNAAAAAGLDVMSDHKNPRTQGTFPELLSIHPWRPAGGPTAEDIAAFATHDPAGRIIYLPDGIFTRTDFHSMRRAHTVGGGEKYFDFLADSLRASQQAARADRVNVFHITVHPGEFRGGPETATPFGVIDRWLTNVVDPLVKAGKVKWATFSEMADAFRAWEKQHPGEDPRATARAVTNPASHPPFWTQPGTTAPPLRQRPAMTEAEGPKPEAPKTESPAVADRRGYITFVVNTHDWPHLEESAATVLRLIGIFERNKVRGEFYFTPQIVEHYQQKRPDVIARLKQSGMGISYHVRPPHPTYGGFDGRLRHLDDATLIRTLRDYETYRLDPATGDLQRDKPGGYTYVAQVFGRKPVVVSPVCRDPRIRDAALKVYAEMGAKMVVAYHESGTKLEQPFEWIHGLLVRPSDFSITRWSVGSGQELFWWNMLDTPDAAAFNPTARLKSQLAAWRGSRPPFITALIHENDFARSNGPGWGAIYYDGPHNDRPKQPPFNLNAPDRSRPRTKEVSERIWKAYEELVADAAATLRVVTSEDIVAMARPAKPSVSFLDSSTPKHKPPDVAAPPANWTQDAPKTRPHTGIDRAVPGTEAASQYYAKVNDDSEFTPRRGGVAVPGGPAPMRLMIATSPDGLKFQRRNLIVTDQGSVPDLVVDQNGWIWLYYQSASVGDEVNRVALALSKDNGASWTFRRVTLRGFHSPKPDPCDPEIQLTEGGTFRLFLTWPERTGRPVSWLTESRDGVNFVLVGQAFDPGGVALDPSVVRRGDTWHIFAGGGRGPAENWHGTSRDGRTFTADRPMRFTANNMDCMMANGIPVPGGVRFYAFNNARPGQPHRIYSFFTRDGITWEAEPGIRLDADGPDSLEMPGFGVLDPAIGRLKDGTYLMVYTTRIPGTRAERHRIDPGPRPRPEAPSQGVSPAALSETDRDALGYHAQTRSFRVCADAGARVVHFNEERSFAAIWTPRDYPSGRVMVLLHGTGGTAYDELKDELPAARQHGYMLIALQWLHRETGRSLDAPVVYRLIDRALHYAAERHGANLNKVALCGFSRGGAISYEVAWRDAQEHRHFRLVICHSGGVPADAVVASGESWHPDQFFGRLNSGQLGANGLQGVNFFLYSGDRDEEWGTRMSEQMAHTQRVLTRAGATVLEWAHDENGGHMGFRANSQIHEKAVGYFLRLTTQSSGARDP